MRGPSRGFLFHLGIVLLLKGLRSQLYCHANLYREASYCFKKQKLKLKTRNSPTMQEVS